MPTPLEKLQSDYQAHYSDMPFETFVSKIHDKFYSDIPFSDFTDKLGLTVPPSVDVANGIGAPEPPTMTPVEGASPWEAGDTPSGRDVARAAATAYRPVLEYGGLAGGAALGTASGPMGTVAGAGLGYGMGRQTANLLDEYAGIKTPEPFPEQMVTAGKDILTGGAMEAGGQVLGKGIDLAGAYISKSGLPEMMYASSVKMPLYRKWTKVRGPEATTDIKRAVAKGLEEKVPPSEYGLEMARAGKIQSGKAIHEEVARTPGTASTDDILENGLKRVVAEAKKGEAPMRELETIQKYVDDFRAARSGEMTAQEMQDLKTWLYSRANYDKINGKADALVEAMRKGLAHELRLQLEILNPSLRSVNESNAGWRLLEEALDRSLARRGNRDIINLGTKVMLGRESWPLAIMNQTIGHPQVKSRVAFLLKEANKVSGKAIATPVGYTAFSGNDNTVQDAYR